MISFLILFAPTQTYTDPKTGFRVQAPADWRRDFEEFGGLVSFRSPDKLATITVSGEWSAAATKLADFIADKKIQPTYKLEKADWFAVSWVSTDTVNYVKQFNRKGVVSIIEIAYPSIQKVKLDPIVSAVIVKFVPAKSEEVAARKKKFVRVANLEKMLVYNGNELSWDPVNEVIAAGEAAIPSIEVMLNKKYDLDNGAAGSFPFNGLYIVAKINSPRAEKVLAAQKDQLGLKAWRLRRDTRNPKMGVASREMEALESPDSSLASNSKILDGEPAEFLEKVTNPKVEGPRGGASIYDKVKWKGRIVYLARPGLGYVSVLR